MLLNEFNREIGQVISEYEKGMREPNRAMEITACIVLEFLEQYSELYQAQLEEMSGVINDWEKARIDPEDAIERICAIHRTWIVK